MKYIIKPKNRVECISRNGYYHGFFIIRNITMVSKYLGHSNSSETLNTYSHLFNATSSEVINTINKARNTVEN